MSNKQYLRSLNLEIQKLNGIIDQKIINNYNYKKEALRHKKLLAEIRRNEVKRSIKDLFNILTPSRY